MEIGSCMLCCGQVCCVHTFGEANTGGRFVGRTWAFSGADVLWHKRRVTHRGHLVGTMDKFWFPRSEFHVSSSFLHCPPVSEFLVPSSRFRDHFFIVFDFSSYGFWVPNLFLHCPYFSSYEFQVQQLTSCGPVLPHVTAHFPDGISTPSTPMVNYAKELPIIKSMHPN